MLIPALVVVTFLIAALLGAVMTGYSVDRKAIVPTALWSLFGFGAWCSALAASTAFI